MLSFPFDTEENLALDREEEPSLNANLVVLGANHLTADLSVRTALSLSLDSVRSLTERLKWSENKEILALSTCNRTEIYAVGIERERLITELTNISGLDETALSSHLYFKVGRAAVAHLFAVACGLNSAAVGESEILGQLKAASTLATELGGVGKILRPLIQRTLRVSKKVRSESDLGRKGLSVASVAVKRAAESGHPWTEKNVLILGAGQIAESIAKSLSHHGCTKVTVVSRTLSKAFTLAAIHGYNAVAISQLDTALVNSDVVFCAAAVEKPVITLDHAYHAIRENTVLVDLGVPANVASDVKIAGRWKVIDMEDLTREVARNLAHVSESTPKAFAILEREVDEYLLECQERSAAPSIEALVRRVEEVRLQNLEWALSQIPIENARERKLMEDLSIRLTRGVLNDPIKKLKNDFREPTERAVLARFFQAEA